MNRATRVLIIATATLTSALSLTAPALAQRGHEDRGKGKAEKQVTRQQTPVAQGHAIVPAQQAARVQQQAAPVQRAVPVQRPAAVQAPAPAQHVQRYAAPPPAAYHPAPHYAAPYYAAPYYYGPRYVVRQPVFVQPYYVYHPHFTFSFGIGVGYGVAYPWAYWNPYGFYNYGVAIHPGYATRSYYNYVGGLSLDIQPWGAGVYVDNQYVGVAADFGPNQMPLTLPAGRHRVELRSEGYRTARFNIDVVAGQVIPYRGTLGYD